jgi:hypothetical protein
MVNGRDFISDNISAVRIRNDRAVSIVHSAAFKMLREAPRKETVQRQTGKRISVVQMDETYKTVDGKRVKIVRPTNVLKEKSSVIENVRRKINRPVRSGEKRRSSVRAQSVSPESRNVSSTRERHHRISPTHSRKQITPQRRSEPVSGRHVNRRHRTVSRPASSGAVTGGSSGKLQNDQRRVNRKNRQLKPGKAVPNHRRRAQVKPTPQPTVKKQQTPAVINNRPSVRVNGE